MEIVITEWALQSYLDLKSRRVFSRSDYLGVLRPDVELLRDGYPSPHAKFQNAKFWGPATDMNGRLIQDGWKMKWHNLGPGKVQFRLAIATLKERAFLCQAYVKTDEKVDRREMAKLKIRIRDVVLGQYVYRGSL